MREFIRLQLKLKWGFNRNNNKASAVMTAIAALFAVAIALALVFTLSYALKAAISVAPKKLCVLYLTVIALGLTIASTGMQMRRLFRPADLLITARFPLSPFRLFVSYLILCYIDLTLYSLILLLPVMLVFGIAMECFSVAFVFGVILGTLLMPLVPFGLSIFLAIPANFIVSVLERHGVLRLVCFVLVLVGAFLLYSTLLSALADFFIHRNWEQGTLEIWQALLDGLDRFYNPLYYLGNIFFFERTWLGLGVWLLLGAVLLAGGVALAKVVCAKLRTKALDGGNTLFSKPTRLDAYSDARAIFRFGLKDILRTKTYSYFYLGVAISTPVMVFFCNRFVTNVGVADVGSGINFGASMLVVAVFMAMISSFTATVLSVEGKNFYITKLVPVPYRKQLLIKGLLNIGVSAVALLISAALIAVLKFITAAEMGVLIASQLLLAAGFVFNGVNLNLANPNLKPKANGEAEEINITYMLLIGLAVAGGIGACCIIFPKIFPNGTALAYTLSMTVSAVYFLINFVVYWFTVEKKYRKIEA